MALAKSPPRSASSPALPDGDDGRSLAARLRVTRHYRNGERAVDAVQQHELGALHDQRPGRTVCVAWDPAPRTVLVVATPHNAAARAALPVVVATLRRLGALEVLVESEAMAALVDGERPGVVTNTPWRQDVFRSGIREDVDLVISLGGDGLILHVVSELFPRAVPPIMPFNLGSMGFLTPFNLREHAAHISRVLAGENNSVTMRMRLKCVVVPKGSSLQDANDRGTSSTASVGTSSADEGEADGEAAARPAAAEAGREDDLPSPNTPPRRAPLRTRLLRYHVLNEIVIDRGPAPYLSNLEVLADDCAVTRVQADGIIVATPTGSTAYSLSSGGSMVHPTVPAILFTPICPHSLSFRPVIFPHDAVLQIKVPEDARASAWVSFDGRHRMELMRGDKVVVWASDYPVPTFSAHDPTTDWFTSVSHCLRWNERVQQASFYSGAGADVDHDADGGAGAGKVEASVADVSVGKLSLS
jgi:NAD kinase